jgi:hypothetical protein
MRPAVRAIAPHPLNPALALVPLTRGMWAVIDSAHAGDVGRFNWYALKGTKTYYAETNHDEVGVDRDQMSLHRFVAKLAGLDVTRQIDHKNGDGLDCRTANLRPCTKATNAWNRPLDRNNRSGIKGVHFEAFTGKWRAEIWVNKAHYRLGRFASKDEAAQAIAKARAEHHGEFANDGHAWPRTETRATA